MSPQLTRKQLDVVMLPELDDGAGDLVCHRLPLVMADNMAAAGVLRKRGLDPSRDAVDLGAALGYVCMVRNGKTDLKFEEWALRCVSVTKAGATDDNEDGDDDEPLDPTRRAVSNDSA